jgi:hypothetical protein
VLDQDSIIRLTLSHAIRFVERALLSRMHELRQFILQDATLHSRVSFSSVRRRFLPCTEMRTRCPRLPGYARWYGMAWYPPGSHGCGQVVTAGPVSS